MPANAVVYIRRSSDSESQSEPIPQQVSELDELAAEKGYRIVRSYIDDAISGDATEKRDAFQRMIADASERRDFEYILCWDLARFGRFDSIEAGFYIYPLRKAGVRLVTKQDGLIDWNDPMHRMCNSMKQEGKHQQLLDHSANVVRAQRKAVENGSWLGSPPYAYRIEGKKNDKRLVIDDPAKVRVVQRIFREFVEEGRSMLNIAKRLNDDGFPPPGKIGRPWKFDSVRTILENPAYVGDYASGRASYGKYNTVLRGKVVGGRKCIKNRQEEWIVRRDNHESIIDRETFEKAKEILARGKTGRSTQYSLEENPFVLTGLLRCGKCGGPMWGDKNPRSNGAALTYRCGNWQYNGKEHCQGTKVYQSVVLQSLAGHLREWIGMDFIAGVVTAGRGMFDESNLPQAFDDIKKLVCPPSRPKQDRVRLQKQADKLKADAAKARGNLALLDAEFIPDVQKKIRELDAQREEIEKELEETKPVPEKDINALAKDVFFNLIGLSQACHRLAESEPEPAPPIQHDDPKVAAALNSLLPVTPRTDAVREVKRFLSHVGHIAVHSEAVGQGTGKRHRFVRGELVLKVGGIKRESNPHFLVVIQVS